MIWQILTAVLLIVAVYLGYELRKARTEHSVYVNRLRAHNADVKYWFNGIHPEVKFLLENLYTVGPSGRLIPHDPGTLRDKYAAFISRSVETELVPNAAYWVETEDLGTRLFMWLEEPKVFQMLVAHPEQSIREEDVIRLHRVRKPTV